MTAYFFDSSALVKRYAVETGSAWVESLTDPRAGNRVYVAAITHVESNLRDRAQKEDSVAVGDRCRCGYHAF